MLPRAADLSDFYTTDEAYFWQGRVARFSAALSMGDWAATNQTGHPGVTTMWLGALGQRLAGLPGVQSPAPGAGAGHLAALRLPLAIANALAVAAGYLLLRRLVRPGVALLAALLWAASPFLIAHGRLLHLDGLLASLTTLSLLCLLVAAGPPRPGAAAPRRTVALLASGVLGGLALLTKAPALLLLPSAGAILLAGKLWGRPWRASAIPAALVRAAGGLALWLLAAAVAFAALWPALWVGPAAALGAVFQEIFDNGAQPHSTGNFFMGLPVADPGWPFYPAVMAWRGEIPTLAGLTALLALGARQLWLARGRDGGARPLWPSDDPGEAWTAATLGGFVVLFTLALSLLAKKFDRYLLPVWPALQILGAIGLAGLADQLRGARPALAARRGLLWAGAAALAAAITLPALIYRPYYLAYYNPLLGGGTTAQAVLLAGWGEGMEQAGAWLSARPDLRRGPVLSWLPVTLAPFIPADVAVYDLDVDRLMEPASYAVVYSGVAERDTRTVAEAYALQTPPLLTLRVHGVTYLTIHQLPRPFQRSVGAIFGGIHLRGYTRTLDGDTLTITPSWDVQADRPGGVLSFVHILDDQGRRVAQIDAQIDDGLFPSWQAGQQFGTPLPISLPAGLPPGEYQAVLGLYTLPDGARVPLAYAPDGPLPEGVAGPDAIQLFTFTVDEGRLALGE
jgi:4-amino-4-deoxy-L-arabinose transferase-like glycosyltransferase